MSIPTPEASDAMVVQDVHDALHLAMSTLKSEICRQEPDATVSLQVAVEHIRQAISAIRRNASGS